jgi:RimJ/RimL family protein N-acetyltransferase
MPKDQAAAETNQARFGGLVPPRIATARLTQRPVEESAHDNLVEGLDDLSVVRYLARVPFPYRRSDAEDFLLSVRHGEAEGIDLTLAIDRDGRAIGCMGLASIGEINEFGYWLRRDCWGEGLATEAGRAFLAYCFGPLGQGWIASGVFFDNPASLRVQEKLGFIVTGKSRRVSFARKGEVDHIDTALSPARFREVAA